MTTAEAEVQQTDTAGARHIPYEPGALTLAQFCSRYSMNRATLFRLRRDGLGPEEIHVGRKILITHRAAAEWEMMMAERVRAERILKQHTA